MKNYICGSQTHKKEPKPGSFMQFLCTFLWHPQACDLSEPGLGRDAGIQDALALSLY